jgi:hypothetical protein
MRKIGAVKAEWHPDGSLKEVLLGPEPQPKAKPGEKKEEDPRARKREHYTNLFNRIPSDVELDMLPD